MGRQARRTPRNLAEHRLKDVLLAVEEAGHEGFFGFGLWGFDVGFEGGEALYGFGVLGIDFEDAAVEGKGAAGGGHHFLESAGMVIDGGGSLRRVDWQGGGAAPRVLRQAEALAVVDVAVGVKFASDAMEIPVDEFGRGGGRDVEKLVVGAFGGEVEEGADFLFEFCYVVRIFGLWRRLRLGSGCRGRRWWRARFRGGRLLNFLGCGLLGHRYANFCAP